jgi:DNA-binding beta-propeller fold protein YncE
MRSRQRTLLVIILILLLLLLGGLVWYYLSVVQPPRSAGGDGSEELEHVASYYGISAESTGFVRPARIGVAPDGDLYVSDSSPSVRSVYRMGQDGVIGDELAPTHPFASPQAVAVWDDGTVWVGDYLLGEIVVFDEDGNETGRITHTAPTSINIVEDRAYVGGLGTISVYEQSGTLVDTFGIGRGRGDGELDLPHGALPFEEDVVVADSLNSRVVRLDAEGAPVWTEGYRPPGMNEPPDGPYNLPSDIQQGERGYFFVLDGFEGRIMVVDPTDGQIVLTAGEWGSDDGQFYYPDGLAYLGGDRYAVADKFNGRVQVVRIALPGSAEGVGEGAGLGIGGLARLLLCGAAFLGLLLLLLLLLIWYRRRGPDDGGDGDASESADDRDELGEDLEFV